MQEKTSRIGALTAIRFFAALHVVLFHVGVKAAAQVSPLLASITKTGYASVGLFYVLSGFVIAYSYAGRRDDARAFWIARFARIYPLYALSLLLALPAFISHVSKEQHSTAWLIGVLVTVPAGVQAWFPQFALAWNTPAWSLSVEFFFYLIFPFLLKPIRKMPPRTQIALVGGLWLLSVTPSLIYCLQGPMSFGSLSHVDHSYWAAAEEGSWLSVINFNPLCRLGEFVAGIALGCLFVRGSSYNKELWCSIGAVASAVVMLVFLAQPTLLPYPLIHNGLLTPLWCVLIYCLAGSGSFARVLGHKWLLVLGEASFAVYILQQPVSSFFKAFLAVVSGRHITGDYSSLPLFLCYLMALFAVSVLSHYYWELPARRWVSEKLRAWFTPHSVLPNGSELNPRRGAVTALTQAAFYKSNDRAHASNRHRGADFVRREA